MIQDRFHLKNGGGGGTPLFFNIRHRLMHLDIVTTGVWKFQFVDTNTNPGGGGGGGV